MCTFDIIFWSVQLTHYYVYTIFGVPQLSNVCNWQFKKISLLYIQTLHNDCSHIEDVYGQRRSRAEFGFFIIVNAGNVHNLQKMQSIYIC